MNYLYPKQVIYLHKQIIGATGGSHGVRDKGLMESAVYRPQSSFGGQDFYPDLFLKTAVLGYSLINNHPFVDGNKRVGFESMRLILRMNRYDIHASQSDKYSFIMKIAEGDMGEQEIANWIKTNSTKLR